MSLYFLIISFNNRYKLFIKYYRLQIRTNTNSNSAIILDKVNNKYSCFNDLL